MNKNVIGIIIAVVAVAGIAGVVVSNKPADKQASSTSQGAGNDMGSMENKAGQETNSGSGNSDQTGKAEVTMDIKEFAFANKEIKISKGTKVTWTNQDEARHNVFSEDDGGPKGELLGMGESFSYTFDTAGTFNYLCEPHPYMKGVVNVVE